MCACMCGGVGDQELQVEKEEDKGVTKHGDQEDTGDLSNRSCRESEDSEKKKGLFRMQAPETRV